MSINVTVSGNPVSIKRGRMVTTDSFSSKDEYDKRRLMRLEQVRQQSRDIAGKVRNKVHKEKIKYMKKIHEEGKVKLEEWKNRKLLELQSQYKEALDAFALGHNGVELVEKQLQDTKKEELQNKYLSVQRGRDACTKLQIDKNKENLKKSMNQQSIKLTGNNENSTAILPITKKTGNKNKQHAIQNISIDSSCDTDLSDIQDFAHVIPDDVEQSSQESNGGFESPRQPLQKIVNLGHEGAQRLETQIQDTKKEEIQNKCIPLHRVKGAGIKSQADKNQERLRITVPLQCETLTKENDNERESEKNKQVNKNKQSHASININIDCSCHTDQPDISDLKYIEPVEMETSSQESNKGFEYPKHPLKTIENLGRIPKVNSCGADKNLFIQLGDLSQPESSPLDTRISDQIKKRKQQNLESDYCDIPKDQVQIPNIADNTRIKNTINFPGNRLHTERSSSFNCTHRDCQSCPNCDSTQNLLKTPGFKEKSNYTQSSNIRLHNSNNIRKQELKKNNDVEVNPKKINQASADILLKAPIKMKDVPLQENHLPQNVAKFNKVQYYDHSNKFLSEKDVPVNSFVEKMSEENVEIMPDIIFENHTLSDFQSRDRESYSRGRKAIATERVKKDYEDMLKKLPILQKKEKILELKKNKPEHHMSENRLKNVEKLRQNKLENGFNKIFRDTRPSIITLPKICKESEVVIPERKMDESLQSIDLNKCQTKNENHGIFSVEEVQEIVNAFNQQKSEDRTKKLKELLSGLKLQKDELIKELKGMSLNEDKSINDLINDLVSFDKENIPSKCSKKRNPENPSRKRRHTDKDILTENTSRSSSSSGMREQQRTGKSKKDKNLKSTYTFRNKKKNRHKLLILQNAGTQTAHKASENEHNKKPTLCKSLITKICEKKHIPCECEGSLNPEELCRILINLNEEKPALIVESEYLNKEKCNDNMVKMPHKGVDKKLSLDNSFDSYNIKSATTGNKFKETIKHTNRKAYKNKQVKTCWRDHLSKHSASTSSTSYMSPPNIHKPICNNGVFSRDISKKYDSQDKSPEKDLYDTVFSNLQKFNYESVNKIHPNLVLYIEKLLGMSRDSIENLNISSTSSVTTPSQSLIELDSNNPISHFQEVIKQFSLKIGKVAKQLSLSPDQSPVHFNTSVTTSEGIDDVGEKLSEDYILNKNGPVQVYKKTSKEDLLKQYSEITDSCSKRIASLAAMIQQIRTEKLEMLHSTQEFGDQVKSPLFGDKELSSVYMDFAELGCSKNNQKSSSSSSLSTDEEEILKKLLEVDIGLARKLQKLGAVETSGSRISEDITNVDKKYPSPGDFQKRLESLLKTDPLDHGANEPSTKLTQKEQHFFSFLSDIPKLPKLQAESNNVVFKNHKRPPPSKGLSIAKKFNENILLVPHELSTIVEADSQISTKMGNGLPSPTTPKSSPLKDVENSPSNLLNITEINSGNKSPTSNIFSRKFEHLTDPSTVSFQQNETTVDELSSNKTPCTSGDSLKQCSSSCDDIETIEAMLKSIGMEWAISTLHKTKEALALSSSSSSSFEISHKLFGNNANVSDITLKSLLSNQLSYKILSGNSISDDSPVSFLREFSSNSVVQANSKEQQRTSTPLTTSKSNDGDVFSIETDISSVKCTGNHS